jgi:hypothetical protein
LSADLQDMLEHLKGNLWHGKVDRALEILDELAYALDVEDGSLEHRKLLKAVRAFEAYLTNHRAFLPNYGERYRQKEPISAGFTDSAVNPVGEQTVCEKAADALDRSRRPPAPANSGPSVERGLAFDALALAPRNGGVSRKKGRLASGLPRSPSPSMILFPNGKDSGRSGTLHCGLGGVRVRKRLPQTKTYA